jgi:NAD(P)-dependent dehydrogenase (short-subunit alcohol dehydrogenase family)
MKIAITGATSGIGWVTLMKILPHAEQVFLLARNKAKAEELLRVLPSEQSKKVVFVFCDLADFGSVEKAAKTIQSETKHLDCLVNNAGGIFEKKELTNDGVETTLAANHLGHFLLTNKLINTLLAAKNPKVINVSSEAHRMAKPDFNDLNFAHKSYSSFLAYANVKLFNILFSKSLVDRYGKNGLRSYSLHPGVVKTNFGKETKGIFKLFWKMASPFMISADDGAKNSLFLIKSDPAPELNGYYFKNQKPLAPSSLARSQKLREQLWQVSEKMLENWM